jgi:hypothetical protein
MLQRFLCKPFLSLGLMLSLAGCAKKAVDPEPAPNRGSYQWDGQSVTGEAKAQLLDDQGNDLLTLQIITAPPAPALPKHLIFNFRKRRVEPVSAYQLDAIYLVDQSGGIFWYGSSLQYSITSTRSGGVSGTFAGAFPAIGGNAGHSITQGSFTDARY